MPAQDAVSLAIAALADHRDLTASEAEGAFAQVMRGEATGIQMSALLMGLRAKGEAAAEVVGAVRALRGAMQPVEAPGTLVVDTCGTGGGTVPTFNISTAAAFVAAGAGARVAKHGNRSYRTLCGSADVLEALGMRLPPDAAHATALLERCGMTFMFAPLFHPAMRHVGPVRRELGIGTIMNVLGPLANPAGVRRQVVGVAEASRARLLADALLELDADWVMVVHARAGMDEIAPAGPTDVWEVRAGTVREWTLEPEALGLAGGDVAELAGGTPEHNAAVVRDILAGKDRGLRRRAAVLNAAAALVVAERAADWPAAVAAAQEAIDSGKAAAVLEAVVRESAAPETGGA